MIPLSHLHINLYSVYFAINGKYSMQYFILNNKAASNKPLTGHSKAITVPLLFSLGRRNYNHYL